tara:strand:+ start:1038 stop:1706 length:669 start_codon:yes stop_codon:yes gene_type:complete
MKIALCFYGEARHVVLCYDKIYENLIKNNDVDVFIHTWRNKDFSDALEIYNPISFHVSSPMTFNFKKKHPVNYYNCLPQAYSISSVRKLKMDYELENNFKYDIVIKTRFDLMPLNTIDFSKIPLDKINVCSQRQPNSRWFDDNLTITNSILFDKLFDMFNHIDEYLTLKNAQDYNTPGIEFFGEGMHLFFSDYHNVYNKINKMNELNWNIAREQNGNYLLIT